MSRWIQIPVRDFFVGPSVPYLIVEDRLRDFLAFLSSNTVRYVEIDLNQISDTIGVITTLKENLYFPDWCGSNWDSIDDAFEEIRRGWELPLVLVIRGMWALIHKVPYVGLQVILRLQKLAGAFSTAGDQFTVVYVAGS